ncbi:MAG: MFS transporter [Promethearchaeota archaeon]
MSLIEEITPENKVKFSTKFYYGISAIGSSAVAGVFATSLIIFYRETLLLSEMYIILAFILYAIWNAINDPLFGWLSDNTKTRWGRRIPYLIIFAPVMAIAFFLIWICPTKEEIGEFGVFIWMLLTMLLYDTAYTAALLVYSALGQELSMDHRERANIQIFSMIFGIIGTFAALVLPLLFLGTPGSKSFIFLVLILAVIQFVTMWITAFKVKEKMEFSHVSEPLSFKDSLRETFKNKSFRITVAMNFCMIFVQSVILGVLFFYVYYVFQDYDIILILGILVLFLMSGIIVGIFYILKINALKGLKNALIRSLFLLGIGLILVGALPGLFSLFGFFIVGIGLFGVMALVNAAFGDVADEDEVKTSSRREAAIFGVNAFITKPAQSVAGAFIALMLLLFHYKEPTSHGQSYQSDITIIGLKLAIGIIPGLVVIGAILIYKMSPLEGEYLKQIKDTIKIMHEKKREQYKREIKT